MKTADIILVLDNAACLRREMQQQLRVYVLDRSVPLDLRFKAWAAHCDKLHHRDDDIDFVDKLLAAGFVMPFSSRGTVTYHHLLFHYADNKIVMELIIEKNFGSLIIL
jgi:hypothetical protein